MTSYEPADAGGYVEGMTIQEKYHCWAASQYREKVNLYIEVTECHAYLLSFLVDRDDGRETLGTIFAYAESFRRLRARASQI